MSRCHCPRTRWISLISCFSLSLPVSFYSYDAFPSAECLHRITPAIPPLLYSGPHLQGKPPAPPETTMATKTSDAKSEGNPLLNQRTPQTSEVQPPTQMETFHSTTGQSSQKNRKEMETEEQNIRPIKTNSEIITWTYNHPKPRCLDDSVRTQSIAVRAICLH